MPSNHLILCCPLLFLSAVFPSIRVFSSELALCTPQPGSMRQMRAYSFGNTRTTLEPESRAHLCFLLGVPKLFSNRVFLVLAVTMVRSTGAGPHARIRQGEPGAPGARLCGQAWSRLLQGHRGEDRRRGTPGENVGKNSLCAGSLSPESAHSYFGGSRYF